MSSTAGGVKRRGSDGSRHESEPKARRLSSCDPSAFSGPFPSFRKPVVLGCFSLDREREYHDDRTGLKFYRRQKEQRTRVRIDLNEGMKNVVRKDEDACKEERLSNLLKWISLNKGKFRPAEESSSDDDASLDSLLTDFVCFRGLFTMIMCTPYERRDDWILSAVKYRNTIFLHKEETPAQRRQRSQASERMKRMCSWGYKFEQCVNSDRPDELPKTDEPVFEPEEFCCIFRTRLGPHSIVYGAEMDGVEVVGQKDEARLAAVPVDAIDLNAENFVELKTSRHIEHPGQETNFKKFKLIKWWCQCFPAGIRQVACGFRDDDGIVETIQTYNVSDLPKICADYWSANVCMNFLEATLTHIKSEMSSCKDGDVVYFEWSPRDRDRIRKRFANRDISADSLLPKTFREDVFKRKDNL